MKSRKTIVLLIGLILVIILVVVGYFKLTTGISDQMTQSEPKQYAVKLAKEHQLLQDYLGKNIVEDTLEAEPKGSGQMKLGIGVDGLSFGPDAVDLEIPITGERDDALLKVKAIKKKNIWTYKMISAHVKNADTIITLN